jgi:hypothetical protein
MRALALVFLTACAGSAGNGPAWPKAHDTEADGGESLAPHTAKTVATIGVGVDVEEVKPATAAATVTPAGAAEGSAAPVATTPATDEVINTEEIIIEIDE